MTTPTFRPIDDAAFDDDRALSAEHGRRIVRDTLATYNERCLHAGQAYTRFEGDGSEVRTLWRWCANWGYVGPWHIYVPASVAARGFVRLLLGMRTNGGAGAVRVYAHNDALPVDELTMSDDTSSGAPGSEQQWYVCASGPGVTDFDFALRLPVQAGWNRVRVALLCNIDTNRAAVNDGSTTSGTTLAAPSYTVVGSAVDTVGAAVFLATDTAAATRGEVDLFTVPRGIEVGNSFARLLFEPTRNRWRERIDDSPYTYSGSFYCVVAYIDSLAIDGSRAYQLEDRQFGPAFRYRQPIGAAAASSAAIEAQNAHFDRLPMVAIGRPLIGSVPVALDPANGVARLWSMRQVPIASPTLWTPFARLLAGVAAATPAIERQGTYGAATYEVRFSAALLLLNLSDSQQFCEVRARLVNAAGTDIATVEERVSVPILLGAIVQQVAASNLSGPIESANGDSAPTPYGCEGMVVAADLDAFTDITLTITAPLLSAEPVQRIILEFRGDQLIDGPQPQRLFVSTPPAVRLIDAD